MITTQNTFEIVGSPTRAKKLVNKFNAWIDRDGNFYTVAAYGHCEWVQDHIEGVWVEDELEEAGYSDLEDGGWIHLTEGRPQYIPARVKISHQQRTTLEKWDSQQTDRVHIWDSYINSLLDCGTLEDC